MSETSDRPLRIVHAVRAPVGGIFRHILDLANGQVNAGHHVGIIADSLTGGERATAALAEIAPRLKLGVRRLAIHREPHPADFLVWARFMYLISHLKPDVVHGHGAKAGAFIRMIGRSKRFIRVYTPHGGSLHYPLNTWRGAFYSRMERALMNNTELFLFESAFARDTYQRTIGVPTTGLVRCVFNGVTAAEFDPVDLAPDASDVAYVGEFRHIKGADLLIDAVARLRAGGIPVTLTLGGDGEEFGSLKAKVEKSGLTEAARFIGHVKARFGFSKGKLLVVPSRGELNALRRDRSRRGRHPDDRRQCRRHSRNFRFPHGRVIRAQLRRRHGGRDRDRAEGSGRHGYPRQNASRKNLHALFAEGHGRRRSRQLRRGLCQALTILDS